MGHPATRISITIETFGIIPKISIKTYFCSFLWGKLSRNSPLTFVENVIKYMCVALLLRKHNAEPFLHYGQFGLIVARRIDPYIILRNRLIFVMFQTK